jgi:predicted nucleotide-binding protein (sugar kinase/HSP70/actin superfamily)
VSLIRKGLASTGLSEIPIIVLSYEEIDPQAGLRIDEGGLAKRLGLGIVFADALARMYLATMVREKTPGTAQALHSRYLSEMEAGIENADYRYLINLLKRAVTDFNRIEAIERPVPIIGVVGEIFVKYNFFSNGNIIDWLTSQGVEVALPPLQNFFAQRFINETYDQKAFFKRSLADRIKYRLLEIYSNYHVGQIERILQEFRFYRKAHDLRKLAAITGEVVSLANQFGEGWLLTAEMIAMLNEGIGNIVCLQPFGCIANHITGRGLENKLRDMYPYLNLLSLDMDAGASEVNVMNRLHFLVTAAREEVDCGTGRLVVPEKVRQFTIPTVWTQELNMFNNYASLEVEKWRAWISGLRLWEKVRNVRRRISL